MRMMFFACLIAAHIYAVDPPTPIVGFAVGPTPYYALTYESMNISFSLPQNWGLGCAGTDNRGLNYIFFPIYEGCGCSVQITPFKQEAEAKEEVDRLWKTFLDTQALTGGFEAIVSNAFYSCRRIDFCVIETWYSLNRERSADDDAFWNAVKSCVSVSPLKQ